MKDISMKFSKYFTRPRFLTYPDNIERKVAEGVDSHYNHQHFDQLKDKKHLSRSINIA